MKMKLGNELKVERIRHDIKANAAAAEIGISPQQLYNIEQGDMNAVVKYIAFLRKKKTDLNNLFDRIEITNNQDNEKSM